MTNTLNTPIEALERSFPMRALRYRLRQGSGVLLVLGAFNDLWGRPTRPEGMVALRRPLAHDVGCSPNRAGHPLRISNRGDDASSPEAVGISNFFAAPVHFRCGCTRGDVSTVDAPRPRMTVARRRF